MRAAWVWSVLCVIGAVAAFGGSVERAASVERGEAYLLGGDYIGAGIPLELWRALHINTPPMGPALDRPRVDPSVPWDMNQYVTPEGVEVVSGVNCIGCHASPFMGGLVIGMGNSFADWTRERSDMRPLKFTGGLMFPAGSDESAMLRRFIRGAEALEGGTMTPFRGVTPAFRIEELAAAHRDPETLAWRDEPVFEEGDAVIASDVPSWFGLHKKSSVYFNGMGVGDRAKLIQQIGVVMMNDKGDAERITPDMRDLLAFIETLEPPAYPLAIDDELASRGAEVFAANCASCHGTYGPGDAWTYPNKRIPAVEVGTDPLYAERIARSGLVDWYNGSWFADGGDSQVRPEIAYVPPPLDGVWATAPYLHNGSVPTIRALLNSSLRAERWRRSFRDDDYDLEELGWRFKAVSAGIDEGAADIYDTRVTGYGNGGHTYGDKLSDTERRALIEYLKTL